MPQGQFGQPKPVWALALHGGAGPTRGRTYDAEEAHMEALLREGATMLADGVAAIDVVSAMVAALEESGFHVAGRGAAPNLAGEYELDASIMEGTNRKAGAVGALVGFRSPIGVARRVKIGRAHV